MNDKLKMKITIETEDEKDQMTISNHLHEQLRGNQDYIDNNIILSIDVKNTVKLYIFKECENVPDLQI